MKPNKQGHEFKAQELKLSEDSISPHTIYYKEHIVRQHTNDKPSGRTLFIINIPPYVDEIGIKNAFCKAGIIQSVQLLTKPISDEINTVHSFFPETIPASFKVAYLVFSKVAHLHKALNLPQLEPINTDAHMKFGVKKWIEEYNHSVLLPKDLKENIEQFMKKHDERTKAVEIKDKKLEQEDDEGWVTVTKKGKVQSFARSETVENKIMAKEEKSKKRKELQNFYTFQIRESKMKHIVALRQKFEEDKKKIAQIKQSRRFKPF